MSNVTVHLRTRSGNITIIEPPLEMNVLPINGN